MVTDGLWMSHSDQRNRFVYTGRAGREDEEIGLQSVIGGFEHEDDVTLQTSRGLPGGTIF